MKSALRKRLVESPGSLGERARAKRAKRFADSFPDLASMHVLDLGGTFSFWDRLPTQPASVTSVNLVIEGDPGRDRDWYVPLIGSACDLDADFGRARFDLVFSNSTIEHVGDEAQRQLFTDNVHARAERHWIQTPNRSFPLEPHVLFPFEQFLPRRGRALVHRYWPLLHTNATSMEAALQSVDGTDLLDRKEFARLFAGSRIEDERVAAFLPAKSLIAIATD